MYVSLDVKYPLFWSHFNENRIFSTDFPKSTEIQSFVEIHPETAEFSHADRQTDRHDETKQSLFAIFANAP